MMTNAMINYTLDEFKRWPALIDDMLFKLKEGGDLGKLNQTVVETYWEKTSLKFYANLIVELVTD